MMNPWLKCWCLAIGLIRLAMMFVDTTGVSHHVVQGYQAVAHLTVGYLAGVWLEEYRRNSIFACSEHFDTFCLLCAVEIVAATVTIVEKFT